MNDSIEKYIKEHTSPEDLLLQELSRETHLKTLYPRMLCGHVQGKFLEIMSRMLCPDYILEIGTFTGYSAICMAKGLSSSGKLYTIDINEEYSEISDRYFRLAGYREKIISLVGDAAKIIESMKPGIDLVYIDADKENYLHYYQLVIDKVRTGGIILADNVLWGGKVVTGKSSDKETNGIIDFNTFVQQDPRIDNVQIPLRDGILIGRKK